MRTRQLVRSLALWLTTTLAFAIYHSGGSLLTWRLPANIICIDSPDMALLCPAFQEKLVVAGIVSGLGLLLHEQAHQAIARNYAIMLRVEPSAAWLAASIVLALAGLFVVGPTVVWPAGQLSHRQSGRVALAGPAASLAVAALFFASLSVMIVGGVGAPAWFPYFGYVGFRLNAMLGLCSLAPIGRFDGARALGWNRGAFAGAVTAGLILTFVLGNEYVLQWLLRVVTSLEG